MAYSITYFKNPDNPIELGTFDLEEASNNDTRNKLAEDNGIKDWDYCRLNHLLYNPLVGHYHVPSAEQIDYERYWIGIDGGRIIEHYNTDSHPEINYQREVPKTPLRKGQLTVKQLIKKLKGMPQDAPVWHEGCDCYGCADDVKLEEDGTVLITRNN